MTLPSPIMYRWFSLTLCLMVVLLPACSDDTTDGTVREPDFQKEGTLDFIRPDGSVLTIDIEIAETEQERSTGLMRRRSMPSQSGMLFIFEEPEQRSFWMRNTPLPLDIMFVGADSQIVNIETHTRPLSDDRILSDGPAQFVIEVRAGFTERANITPGTQVRWQRTS